MLVLEFCVSHPTHTPQSAQSEPGAQDAPLVFCGVLFVTITIVNPGLITFVTETVILAAGVFANVGWRKIEIYISDAEPSLATNRAGRISIAGEITLTFNAAIILARVCAGTIASIFTWTRQALVAEQLGTRPHSPTSQVAVGHIRQVLARFAILDSTFSGQGCSKGLRTLRIRNRYRTVPELYPQLPSIQE